MGQDKPGQVTGSPSSDSAGGGKEHFCLAEAA